MLNENGLGTIVCALKLEGRLEFFVRDVEFEKLFLEAWNKLDLVANKMFLLVKMRKDDLPTPFAVLFDNFNTPMLFML